VPRKSLGFVEEVFRTFAFLDVDEDEELAERRPGYVPVRD
jgi:hypothetical protein